MTDYISREEAITAIEKVPKGNWSNLRYVNELQSVPAADVRPVVTCKHCSLWCKEESKLKGTAPCSHWSNLEDAVYIYTNENDFCSYSISEEEE